MPTPGPVCRFCDGEPEHPGGPVIHNRGCAVRFGPSWEAAEVPPHRQATGGPVVADGAKLWPGKTTMPTREYPRRGRIDPSRFGGERL
jgi:hypothetical protein